MFDDTVAQQYIEISEIFDRVFTEANHIFKDLKNPDIEQVVKAAILESFNDKVQDLSERVKEWNKPEADKLFNDQNLHHKDCALVAIKEILNCNLYLSQMALNQLHAAHPLSSLNIMEETVKEFNKWLDEVKSYMPDELKGLFEINSEIALNFVDYGFERTSLLEFIANGVQENYSIEEEDTPQTTKYSMEEEKERAKNLLSLIFNNNSTEISSLLSNERFLNLAKELLSVLSINLMKLTFQKTEDQSESIFERQDEFNLLVGKCVLAAAVIEDKGLGFNTLTELGKKRVEIYANFRKVDASKIFDL